MLPLRGASHGLAILSFSSITNLGSSTGDEGATNKEMVPSLQLKECGYYDVQKVQLISRSLLYALGAASINHSIGGLLNQPLTSMENMKREIVDYVQAQIAASTAGAMVHNNSCEPVKLVREALESFVKSKQTLFKRVSSKLNLFGERQDERVERLVQEIEKAGYWITGQRESMAKSFLKKVDRSSTYHCKMMFESIEELAQHKKICPLRPQMCENASCGEVVSAANAAMHQQTCPMKVLPCRQGCGEMMPRAEMDLHTSTTCPMKPVACPFNEVGCTEALAQSLVEQHCSQSLSSHLSLMLHAFLKQQTSLADHTQRLLSFEKMLSYVEVAEAADMGAIAVSVTNHERKVKALEQEIAKLREDFMLVDVSADVLQLRRELRNLQKSQQAPEPSRAT